MQDGTNLEREDERVETCVEALLKLERIHGTRALALAIDEIESVDTDKTGYSERRWAALPEMRERIEHFSRMIAEARGESTYEPKPVTAEPLPPIEDTRLYQLAQEVANEPIPEDGDAQPSAAAIALAEEAAR